MSKDQGKEEWRMCVRMRKKERKRPESVYDITGAIEDSGRILPEPAQLSNESR
jgi:hypothetical protein